MAHEQENDLDRINPVQPNDADALADRNAIESDGTDASVRSTLEKIRNSKTRSGSKNESDPDYVGEIVRLSDGWRVIVFKDGIQWIIQKRDAGGSHGERWRGRHYCTTRNALIRLCGRLGEALDLKAMAPLACLPSSISASVERLVIFPINGKAAKISCRTQERNQ